MYTANDATAHGLSFYARASTRFLVYARDVVQIKNIDIPVIDLDFFFWLLFRIVTIVKFVQTILFFDLSNYVNTYWK